MAGVKVKFGAETSELDAAVQRSKGQLRQLNKEMREGVITASKYAGAAVAAGAAIVTGLAVQGLRAVDAQAKLSRQLGGTITGLRALEGAAGDAGVSSESMSSAMERLNASIGEAQRGTGTAAESFKRLGLNVNALAAMDVDERVAVIADRMKEMGLSTQQAGDELRQMGIRQGEIINLMLQGGDAIRAERDTVEALGLALSDVDARQVEMANDALGIFGDLMTGIRSQLAVEVAPIITALATQLEEAAKNGEDMGSRVSSAFDGVVDATAFVMSAVDGVGRTFETVADLVIIAISQLSAQVAKEFARILKVIDFIPGPWDYSQTIASVEQFGATAEGVVSQAMSNINQTLNEPLAGDKFQEFVAQARQASEEAAAAMAAGGGAGQGQQGEVEDPEAKRHKAELAERLARIMEANMTEQAVLAEKFELEQELIRAALENKLLTQAEFDLLMQDQTLRHQEELTAIEDEEAKKREDRAKAEQDAKKSALQKALSDASTLMNTGSRKLFEIGKAAALGNAFISAKESIVDAFKFGTKIGGPPLGAAFAAAAGAAQFAQISAIKSASFGGGGAGGAGSSGGAASVTQGINAQSEPVGARQSQVVNINVAGGLNPEDMFSGKMIRALFDELNANIDNGMSFNVQ